MPTSTLWRHDVARGSLRGISPTRPTGHVERISPEPSITPSFYTSSYTSRSGYGSNAVYGLGLSEHRQLDQESSTRRAELYTDPNGRAYASNSYADAVNRTPPRNNHPRSARQHTQSRTPKGKGHTRSGSTIDDLADAAIATSPTFANGSPNHNTFFFGGSPPVSTATRPNTSYINRYGFYDGHNDRPAKRVKSEVLPQYEFGGDYPRPTTSYVHRQSSHTIPEEDVALLLGLKQEFNFMTQRSPITAPAVTHQSPQQQQPPYSPVSVVPQDYKVEEQAIQGMQNDEEPLTNGLVSDQADPDEALPDAPGLPEPANIPSQQHHTFDTMPPQQSLPLDQPPLEPTPDTRPPPAPEELPAVEPKKPKRIRPQVQAEVCAECNKLQRESDDEDLTISWISCNACNKWFHANCAGFKTKSEARSVDKYICKPCQPEHGSTTFVRTSSRARTAIDYAELNQGLVKSSIETSMHHYIQPIKNGQFAIQPDDFARVRPEVLNLEFWQNMDNIKRPFVVPAAWNPRFGTQRTKEVVDKDEEPAIFERIGSDGQLLGLDTDEVEPEVGAEQTEEVIDLDQDLLDMVMPRNLTVRKVAELYGKHEFVPVIDVKSQETKGQWTLEQWADYYEDSSDKPVRNVISLEVSETPLGRLIRRPKVVRDLDLEDMVWDEEVRANQKKRHVAFYCLMSVADSFTDFHIDFGGSSVYYHILKGVKTFFFIPPEDRYLKKYEEWCNSHSQNETWLPDLCNGNVTRVDLHEGDTAFIPAGWIHSVWTPEDSLVIGGNFLTPVDYDTQLKVANVEKVTHVAPKFRYPFFQKVMWYALIKYLDEDPVPDDVMRELQDDPDHVFLRVNPVWFELDQPDDSSESDSQLYNARYYPKSEIKGLPALRDYLYRTARIHADLPVDNITKKQIEAVKASVPKGHGDPLVLIKTFAIWCAWKIGSIKVPEWVYNDGSGFPKVKEKAKKPENFRLPGERTSARRAAAAEKPSLQKETTGPAVVTPYKPGYTAAGVSPDPGRKGRPPSVKPTATVRTACEGCRRRRIKCKHREGESPEEDGEQIQSRSGSPEPAALDGEAKVEKAEITTPVQFPALPVLPPMDANQSFLAGGYAQAALGMMDGLASDNANGIVNGNQSNSAKKSRSKACEECRKSKRRCVHDEYGRVDPAKAAEPSKPRGSSNAKRPSRPSDEGVIDKRPRFDMQHQSNFEAVLDPALFAFDPPAQPNGTSHLQDGMNWNTSLDEPDLHSSAQDTENFAFESFLGSATQPSHGVPAAINAADGIEVKAEPDGDTVMTGIEHQQVQPPPAAYNGANEYEHAIMDSPEQPHVNGITPNKLSPASQRHSSRQAKQVERYAPDDTHTPSKILPNERRGSSIVSRTSPASINGSGRRSSSHTSNTVHAMAARQRQSEARDRSISTAESEDADEKMARELQAQEHGLRRRGSMRQ